MALGAGTWLLAPLVLPAKLPPGFPGLPDLRKVNPPMRAAIEAADKLARRRPESPDVVGKLAMVYHANLFLPEAGRAYHIAAHLAPADYRWAYGQAFLEEERGNEAEQFRLLEQTLRLKPDHVPALVKMGDALFKLDRLDEASRFYQSAAAGNALLPAAFGLCRVAARRGEWQQVIDCGVPLTHAYPYLEPPYELLAEAYGAMGQAGRAAQARQAMAVSKSKVIPPVDDSFNDELVLLSCSSTRLLKQAGQLSHLGYPDRGLEVARRAEQSEPGDPDVRFFIAHTLLTSNPDKPEVIEQALAELAECVRLRPDDPSALWIFGQDFFETPKAPGAVERFRALVKPYSDRNEAHFYLGLLADARGDSAESVSQFQTALQNDPGNAAVYNKLGLTLHKAGRLDEAIANFRKSVDLSPMNPVARFNLSAALLQRGRDADGMKNLAEVLRIKPDYAPAHLCLAFACLYSRRNHEAIAHFREGLRYMPGDAEGHFGLASALYGQHQAQDAIPELREALRLRPNYPEAADLLRRLEQ